jgi:hypothetical protein
MSAQTKVNNYVLEYIKCKNSFDYFCTKYIYIELPGGDVLLNPYAKQSDLIQSILKDHFVLTLKSRQIGISTIVKAFSAWLVTFYENVVVGIISKDGPESTDFARDVMNMVDKLPKWMRPTFQKRTERTFILSNGAKCYVSPVAPAAPEKCLRGKAITFLVIDEAAFIKYIDTAWTSLVPALSTNQKFARMHNIPYGTVILSTPNRTTGVGQWFYQQYCNSIDDESLFKHKTIYWKEIPEIVSDPLWYTNTCKLLNNDKGKIEQELELKFIPVEGAFFPAETILALQEQKDEPIETLKLFNGEVWKFAEPEEGKFYIHGVDTATEFGTDKSAHVIFDYETLEQVWEYRGKCRVEDFVNVVKFACFQYPGMVVIESNSVGNQVREAIYSSEHSHMVYKETRKTFGPKGRGKKDKGRQKPPSIKVVPGLSNNPKTRPLIIDSLYSYVTQYPEAIKSERLKLELIGLVTNTNGKVEADTGATDDLAMAASFCYYVRKYDPPKLIDKAKSPEAMNSMREILEMNEIRRDYDADNLREYLKKNLLTNDKTTGSINIFDIIQGNRR